MWAGANHGWHWVRGGVHHRADIQYRHKQPPTFTFTPTGNLESPMSVGLREEVGISWGEKNTQTQGEMQTPRRTQRLNIDNIDLKRSKITITCWDNGTKRDQFLRGGGIYCTNLDEVTNINQHHKGADARGLRTCDMVKWAPVTTLCSDYISGTVIQDHPPHPSSVVVTSPSTSLHSCFLRAISL